MEPEEKPYYLVSEPFSTLKVVVWAESAGEALLLAASHWGVDNPYVLNAVEVQVLRRREE